MPTPVLTPTGRLVQGDFFKPNTTDQQGNPLVIKSGPNKGQPRTDYFGALAFPKGQPATDAMIALMVQQAATSYAALFPRGPEPHNPAGNWGCSLPKFSFKIMDGDGVDDNGKQNASKDGFAGHWVVKFSSGFAPQVWTRAKNLPDGHPTKALNADPETLVQLLPTDAGLCKRGYYYRINGSFDGNGQQLPGGSPGLYTNYNLVELVAFGDEITSGPVAAEVFAAPAGATAPVPAPKPAATVQPPEPGFPADLAKTANWPAGVTYQAMIANGWTPDTLVSGGYATRPLAPAATPPAPAPVAAPAAPTPAAPPPAPIASPSEAPPPPHDGFIAAAVGPQMTAKANGVSYDKMIAAGWTDATLKEHGYLA